MFVCMCFLWLNIYIYIYIYMCVCVCVCVCVCNVRALCVYVSQKGKERVRLRDLFALNVKPKYLCKNKYAEYREKRFEKEFELKAVLIFPSKIC